MKIGKNIKFVVGIVAVLVIAAVAFTLQSEPAKKIQTEDFVVAKVNGLEIFESDVKAMQGSLAVRTGEIVDEKIVLEKVIFESLLLSGAEEAGISVSYDDAEKRLEKYAESKGSNLKKVKDSLESKGIDYEEEVANFRKQLLIESYLRQTIPVREISDGEVKDYYDENKKVLFTGEVVPYEQIALQLKQAIAQREYQKDIEEYITNLEDGANIEYLGNYASNETAVKLNTTEESSIYNEQNSANNP